MLELNYNLRTGQYYEDEPQATTDDVRDFKKQYDAMTSGEKSRLPNWLREYIEQDVRSN